MVICRTFLLTLLGLAALSMASCQAVKPIVGQINNQRTIVSRQVHQTTARYTDQLVAAPWQSGTRAQPDSLRQAGTEPESRTGTSNASKDISGSDNANTGQPQSQASQVPLAVTSTQPGDGAQEVSIDSQLVIVFNRPIVPLVSIDDAADLPQPLTLDPPVSGSGEWINTSIYAFQPDQGLAGAQTYTATVSEITGLSGEELTEPYQFSFTTAVPDVLSTSLPGGQVRPNATFSVRFTQPMDPETTSAAFSITPDSGDSLEGELVWSDNGTELTFTPAETLNFGRTYTMTMTTDALPISKQGALRRTFTQSFSVVPLPAVATVAPVDDAVSVSPGSDVVIRFNTPVSPTTILNNIAVTPMLTTTKVFSYYSPYDNQLQISWFKEPHTQYTVTLGQDIADEYGNTLGQDFVTTFTTGDYAPFGRLEVDRFTHFSAYSPTQVSLLYRNMDTLDVDLYRLPETEFLKLSGSNQWVAWENYQLPNPEENLIWSRSYPGVDEKNISIRQVITLTDSIGNMLPPGLYFLKYDDQKETTNIYSPNISQAVIVLSNNNLVFKNSIQGDSLAWLTDLATGEPVDGESIRFYSDAALLGEGVTANDGTLIARLEQETDQGWMPVRAMSGEPGDANFAVASSEWNSGIGIWEFGLSGGWGVESLQGYFYTDRPIYRPGQTIYWKGIVRTLIEDQYELPPSNLPVSITIRDDQGNNIHTTELTPNQHGTLNGEFTLSPEAGTGFYYLEAALQISEERTIYSGSGFQVAAYRKPEFEISITSDEPSYIQGDTAKVTVQANYFSGGPMSNAPVSWRLISEPYFFNWFDEEEDRYYSFAPYTPDQTTYDPYQGSFYLGLIREGSGETNTDGTFTLELPADIAEASQSQNWVVDVTVQSSTNQFVDARTRFPVHKSAFYIGLSPQRNVVEADTESTVDLVTVTPQGEAYPAAEVDIIVYGLAWNSVFEQAADGSYRWETSVERVPVYTTTLATNRSGKADFTWVPEAGGQYQAVALSQDDDGNPTSGSGFIWVSSVERDQFIAWPRENNDRLELVADKRLYAPGDVAEVLVPSPFTGPVNALFTIERAGVIESQVIELTGNSETLEIPIQSEHIPNIYVSIILVNGLDETNPTPAMRVGYVQLNVDTSEKELAIEAETSAEQVQPGTTVSYTLTIADAAGEPVADAEVSVAIVDKAVLSLAAASNPRMVNVFYYERPLDVTTGATLIINRDRRSQQLSEGAKGGGGGDGGSLELRQDFPDIAYWRATLTSGADGRISFHVDLPDNLTTWQMVAKAVTDDTKVGEAQVDVIATKELQVRPLLPRFFTAGDRAKIGAAVLNTAAYDLTDGVIRMEITGAEIEGDTDSTVLMNLDAGEQQIQQWPISVDTDASEVVVTLRASGERSDQEGNLSDSVRITLPVLRYESPEMVATSGEVPPEGVVEAIDLPENATDNGQLVVGIEPSLASGMVEGLDYLEHYPYECNEQTVSRFLPNLFTVRALQALDITDPELEAALNYQLGIGVQRLVSRQNPDGGWGYWPGEESTPFITTYVLWGLSTVDSMGYTVPQRTLDNGVNYLELNFEAPKDVTDSWRLNEMAFMHFVLSEMDEGDPGRMLTLYDVRERLDHYGVAFLAMALNNLVDDAQESTPIQTLMDDLFGAAQITAIGAFWQENEVDYWTLNTNIRSTAIILAAFTRIEPDQPLLPQVVRWLMHAREAGRWSTTQENAWSLIALTEWLEASGELEAGYSWAVSLNDQILSSGDVSPTNLGIREEVVIELTELLRGEANILAITRSNDSGSLYYTGRLTYYLDAMSIDARDRGIVVDRRFASRSDETLQTVNDAAVGDVISVTVTIIAPTDLHQLLVEVPIPAGLEPIDPNLAITSDQFGGPEFGAADSPDSTRNWWRYWTPTYTDMRDDKVVLFATYLPAGTYEFTLTARASIPGEYRVLPVYAEQMYFNEVWGRSAGSLFTVKE